MYGVVEIKDGEGLLEYGESSCSEVGILDEVFGVYVIELYVEIGFQRQELDISLEDGVEVYFEGDIGV